MFNNLICHVIIFFLILKCSRAIFTFSATSNHPKKEPQLAHLLINIKSKGHYRTEWISACILHLWNPNMKLDMKSLYLVDSFYKLSNCMTQRAGHPHVTSHSFWQHSAWSLCLLVPCLMFFSTAACCVFLGTLIFPADT